MNDRTRKKPGQTAAGIISELRGIDAYLGNVTPFDDPGAAAIEIVRKARLRRKILLGKLKRLHGVDYEGIRAAERLQKDSAHEMLIAEFNAALEKFMRGAP